MNETSLTSSLLYQNRNGDGECEQHGVEEVGDDFEGRERCESGCHQELRTVGDETLNDARAGVEDAGTTAAVHTVAVGKVFRDFAYAENGNCVVSGAKVGEAHQRGDATFCPSAAAYAARQFVDEVSDAAIDADELQYSAGNHRYEDEFAHSADAACHGGEPPLGTECTHADAYQTSEQIPDEQHDEHVLAHQC